MSTPGPVGDSRPAGVTFAGRLTVIGSVIALVTLVTSASQLQSQEMRDAVNKVLQDPRVEPLHLTLDSALELVRYTVMVMAVVSVAALVLGVYVLRRHRPSRVALTVLGAVVALFALFGGPPGWIVTAYVAVSVWMLWTKPARAWFASRPG